MAAYPTDPRVLIQVFRKRGRRLHGRVEVLFENDEPHPFDLVVEQVRAAQFSRSAQWGVDNQGRSASRFVRTPISWSVDKNPPIPTLIGCSPALEILRVQLSPFMDACKRRLFEQDEKRHGRVDIQRLERPLWRLDMAENAVVIAVGSVWLTALAREHGHRLTRAELTSVRAHGFEIEHVLLDRKRTVRADGIGLPAVAHVVIEQRAPGREPVESRVQEQVRRQDHGLWTVADLAVVETRPVSHSHVAFGDRRRGGGAVGSRLPAAGGRCERGESSKSGGAADRTR